MCPFYHLCWSVKFFNVRSIWNFWRENSFFLWEICHKAFSKLMIPSARPLKNQNSMHPSYFGGWTGRHGNFDSVFFPLSRTIFQHEHNKKDDNIIADGCPPYNCSALPRHCASAAPSSAVINQQRWTVTSDKLTTDPAGP